MQSRFCFQKKKRKEIFKFKKKKNYSGCEIFNKD